MSKILVIGVGNAGRNVCKKLKDDGLSDAEFVTFGGYQNDDRNDIPHYNFVKRSLYPGYPPEVYKAFAEKNIDDIKDFLEKYV